MKNKRAAYFGVALTCAWGVASLGAQIAEAITPKTAKFMRKLGVVVGIGTIGAISLNEIGKRIEKVEAEESTEDNVEDE